MGGLLLELDNIPLPCLILGPDLDVVACNTSYRDTYGHAVVDAHLSKVREQLKHGHVPGVKVSLLEDGRHLALLQPQLEEFHHRERLVREATHMARVGGFELDVGSDTFRWSGEVYDIYGVSKSFVPYIDSVMVFYSDQARKTHENVIARTLTRGGSYDLELPIINARGEKLWVRNRGRAVMRNGRCAMLSGAVQDVTEERKVRKRLAELLERFAFAQSSAAFGVWDYDPTSDSLHWDQAMFPLYDLDPKTFRGTIKDWADCVYPQDLKPATSELEKAIHGQNPFDTEFRIQLRDGSLRWIKANAHVTRGEDGIAQRIVGFNYDITSSKQIEAELRESYAELERSNRKLEELAASSQAASNAKSDFLANMSHEIRTPMNGVVGMSSLLLESDLTPQQRDALDIIRKSADALLQLINDLLDFSKVEAGAVELQSQWVDLREAVDDLVELLAIEAQRKGLHFYYVVDQQVPHQVKTDAGRLRQILINLIGNAVKYTDQGYVDVQVTVAEKELRFQVTDSGRGIPESDLSTIFDPFTRSHDHKAVGGTGLGLAICFRLAKLLSGYVEVESTLGEGSSFSLHLPLEEAKEQDSPPLSGRRVSFTGGLERDREALRQSLLFLGADDVQEDPEVEMVFQGSAPEHETEQRILILPASDVSVFRESEHPGFRGAVTLPVRNHQLEEALLALFTEPPTVTASQERRITFDCRVLLVEDNAVNQKVAGKMLDSLGVRYDTAEHGRAALPLLECQTYDLVFMDLQMPEMDGYDTTIRLRRDKTLQANAAVPVIALTAHATEEHKTRCFDAGLSDFLTKPLRLSELRRVFRKWVPQTAKPVLRDS